jgi:ribulose-5-phosphate 4-epimerase/fuculose-1-phosphate aldolase
MTVHALKTGQAANLRSRVSPEEWQARRDLAACYRLMDLYQMTDLTANPISRRVPGEPDHFLINAYGLLYDETTASSLLKIDHEGNILSKLEFQGVGHKTLRPINATPRFGTSLRRCSHACARQYRKTGATCAIQ